MTAQQLTLPFGPIRNSNLFSNHWLEHRLSLEPEWTECRPFAVRLLGQLAELWRQQKNRVGQYTEPSLEEAFIQPVFKKLGWTLLYQTFLRGRKPDYALFLTEQNLDKALSEGRKSQAFWAHATIVADAKAWTVNLDRPAIINNQREYPPEQIESYIHHSQKDYGILTNGRLWRLYPHNLSPHQPRFNTYFECDLAAMLERWTSTATDGGQRTFAEDKDIIEDFLTFYLFFSPLAFTTIQARKPLIQRAIEGSNEYRLGIGEGLKGRVFEALPICIEGFLSHKQNELDPERDLGICKEQSLILLYRLLFIMYAEDRELLPFRSNRLYRENRSLGRIRDQVAAKLERIEQGTEQDFDKTAQDLWDALSSLFDLIDRGGKQYGVPAYNGGLFDPQENAFLSEKTLPDRYLARAIDGLSRAPDAEHPDAGLFRVDYRDLSIQHLGHVYEGLLELQPNWATEPMAVFRKKNHHLNYEQVIPVSQKIPKGYEYTGIRYETDRVYLVTDKGERRATGSYYTPDYIVNYIVSQTLGPLCQQISEKLADEIKGTEKQFKRARGRSRQLLNDKLRKLQNDFDDRVLQLKVLDPAMGSGHFLLRACQYLAEEIATNPNTGDPVADKLQEDESVLTFWKRRIVEHCLYGVDKNPLAVELAKVALWLETAAIGQPLAFLDHHLRCGNSLIGSWVADLGALPGVEPLPLFEQKASSVLPSVIEGFKAIAGKPSDTRDDVKSKTKIYHEAIDRVRKPFVSIADLWCATFFLDKANQITPDQYQHALQTLDKRAKHDRLLKNQWFKQAIQVAHQPDVGCFHWELEFPDIFFDLSGRCPDAGFDAVIGNPPWGQKGILFDQRTTSYLRNNYTSLVGILDIFRPFVERAIALTQSIGMFGMVLPDIILLKDYEDTRRYILDNLSITRIDWWGMAFASAVIDASTIIGQKNPAPSNHMVTVTVNDAESPLSHQIPQSDFIKNPRSVFNLFLTTEKRQILEQLTNCPRLGDFFEVHEGVHSGNIRKELFVDEPLDDSCKQLLFGRDEIAPYHLKWNGRYVRLSVVPTTKSKKRYANAGKPEWYSQDKVLVRRTGDFVLAALDSHKRYASNNFFILFPKTTCSLDLNGLCALLNSKLSTWYFRTIEPRKGRVFAELKIKHLNVFPIPPFTSKPNGCQALNDMGRQRIELAQKAFITKTPHDKIMIERTCTHLDKEIDELVIRLFDIEIPTNLQKEIQGV